MTQATEGARVAPSVAAPPFGSGRLETTTLGSFELADGTRLPELVAAWRHEDLGRMPACRGQPRQIAAFECQHQRAVAGATELGDRRHVDT